MISIQGSAFRGLCPGVGQSLSKPVAVLVFVFLTSAAPALFAQGLSPSTPAKEYVYFGAQLVVIEQAGPGGMLIGQVVRSPRMATAASTGSSTGSSASTAPAKPGPLPSPFPVTATSSSPPIDLTKTTPAYTHAAH